MILSDWRIILQNTQRFLFLTCQKTITSHSFPTSIAYWENRIHLWALIFGSQNFPVLHMFLKYRYRENENDFQKMREVLLTKNQCTKISFSLYTGVTDLKDQIHLLAPVFSSLAKFLGKKMICQSSRWHFRPHLSVHEDLLQMLKSSNISLDPKKINQLLRQVYELEVLEREIKRINGRLTKRNAKLYDSLQEMKMKYTLLQKRNMRLIKDNARIYRKIILSRL